MTVFAQITGEPADIWISGRFSCRACVQRKSGVLENTESKETSFVLILFESGQ